MGCVHVHDFIRGTTITLPRAALEQSIGQEVWDILRPNEQASELFARHVQTLETLGSHAETEGARSNVSAEEK